MKGKRIGEGFGGTKEKGGEKNRRPLVIPVNSLLCAELIPDEKPEGKYLPLSLQKGKDLLLSQSNPSQRPLPLPSPAQASQRQTESDRPEPWSGAAARRVRGRRADLIVARGRSAASPGTEGRKAPSSWLPRGWGRGRGWAGRRGAGRGVRA